MPANSFSRRSPLADAAKPFESPPGSRKIAHSARRFRAPCRTFRGACRAPGRKRNGPHCSFREACSRFGFCFRFRWQPSSCCGFSGAGFALLRESSILVCAFFRLVPVLLVAACTVLFIVYAPYDHAYREILGSPLSPTSYQDFGIAAYAPFALPASVHAAMASLCGPQGRFLVWSALTAVLVVLCVKLVMRQFKKAHFRRNG